MKKILKNLKNKLPLVFLSCLIVSSFLYIMVSHYKTGGSRWDAISKLEANLLDLRFLIRGVKKPLSKTAILAIDEESIETFGRWPFSRKFYGPAFKNLKNLGVEWIGFDSIFSEPERSSIEDVENSLQFLKNNSTNKIQDSLKKSLQYLEIIKKESPSDLAFAKSITDFEKIILGYFYFQSQYEVKATGREKNPFSGLDEMLDSAISAVIIPEDKNLDQYPDSLKAFGVDSNIPLISKASHYHAFFSNEADNDAVLRWVSLVRIINNNLMPSLSLKMAAEALNRDILVVFDKLGIDSIELVSRADETDSLKLPIDPLGQGRMLANHRGPSKSFRHFSLAKAYKNSFTKEEQEFLKGSHLLLGATAIGINDQRPNPFDPTLDGVEIHATIVDNIIKRDFMHRPKSIYSIELLLLLIIGLIFSPILIFSRAFFSAVLVITFSIGYYYFDHYYWFSKGIWAYIGMPFLEIFTLFFVITIYKYMTEEKEKKKVKGAFSMYLSAEVIEQVLDKPESLQLGGVKKDLTVFFSDVRGFTTISESLSPEKLCEFMNDYFTPMTSIILKSGGVLDKYIGDAIMAFWGAPIPLQNQADVAADAAVRMLFALDKVSSDFKKKGFPEIDIGIGLNTGPMSVGNMGSVERFCYTVMGDSVNLGSRLESLTKEYGIKIMMSEFTKAALTQKHHLFRDLDDIRVKGKNEPIKVFQLLRPDYLQNPEQIKELIQMFEEARKLYKLQDWEQSQKLFTQCLSLSQNDGPSQLYLKRIEEFRLLTKVDNWDGVYTFKHK